MNKTNKFLSLLFLLPIFTIADSYSENLMVITANTMEKRCTNTPHEIYKGTRDNYAQQNFEMSKSLTNAAITNTVITTLNSKPFIEGAAKAVTVGNAGANLTKGIKEGLIIGAATTAISMTIAASIMDSEYLYITECNEGDERTRLMTLVVSNSSMREDEWVKLAKEDQEKALR